MVDAEKTKEELADVFKEHSKVLELKRSLIKREKELRRKIFELQKLLISCGEDLGKER